MDLPDNWFFFQTFAVHAPFFQDRLQVNRFYAVIFGYAFVAAAIRTKAFAERQMQVQTDAFLVIGCFESIFYGCFPTLFIGQGGIPERYGGVTSVTRYRLVVFSDQVFESIHLCAEDYYVTKFRKSPFFRNAAYQSIK